MERERGERKRRREEIGERERGERKRRKEARGDRGVNTC